MDLEKLVEQLANFAELGWVAVILAFIVIAWKPTMGYLTVVNNNRMNHAEKLIASLQKEVQYLRAEVKSLHRELDDWKAKYYNSIQG